MANKSRLKVRKDQRGRRGIFYSILVAAIVLVGWQIDTHVGVSTYISETFSALKASFTNEAYSRGTIYDRNLKQVAVDLERVSVFVRPREIVSGTDTIKTLSEILSLDEKELLSQLESNATRYWVAEDVSQEQEIAIRSKRLSGVHFQKDNIRHYPNGEQAAHLIGYAEKGIGLAGVEYYYDRLVGKKKAQLGLKTILNSPQDLVLTLDLKIQDVLDKIIEEVVKLEKVKKMTAYVMEGQTGEVVGGAQYPGYNPNNFTKYSNEVLVNQAVVPILIPQKFRLFLRDSALLSNLDAGVTASIPWSLKAGDEKLGNQLRLSEWLGLSEQPITEFHLSMQPGEKEAGEQQQVIATQSSIAMVPEVMCPLNLLAAFATLLHDRNPIRPYVVKKNDGDTNGLNGIEALGTGTGQPGDSTRKFSNDIFELLESQARVGESKTLFFRDEIAVSVAHGSKKNLQTNEVLLISIPAGGNDLVMLVVVEKELGGPVHRTGKKNLNLEQIVEEKVERIAVLQQVAKTVADVVEPEISDDSNYPGQKDKAKALSKAAQSALKKAPEVTIMPDLQGLSLRKSLRLLQDANIKIRVKGTGKVVAQQPNPGKPLKGISECTLILEKGEDMTLEKMVKKVSERK